MRKGFLNRNSIAPLLIALTLAAPGCKSGWKMPKSQKHVALEPPAFR